MNRLSEAARELAAATMALVAELAKTQRLDWADATEARVFTALDRVLGLLAAERAAEPAAAAAESFGAFLGRQIGRAAIEAAEEAERAAAAARPAPPPFPGPSRRLVLDKPAANWFSKCCDCGTFAPQIDRRCWGCAERERLRSGRIFPVKMGWGGDGVCSLCQWTCWSEPGVALRPAAGEPAVSLCYVCVWFLARLGAGPPPPDAAAAAPAENPPSKPAPQVPGNTGCASAQTEVPKNDPFPAVAAELGYPQTATNIVATQAAAAVTCARCQHPRSDHVPQCCVVTPTGRPRRGEPCKCTGFLVAPPTSPPPPSAPEVWGICDLDHKPHVLFRDHKCTGWVSRQP